MTDRKIKCDVEAANERATRAAEKLQAGRGAKNYRGGEEAEDFDDEESLEKMQKFKIIAQEILEERRQPHFFTSVHPLSVES